MLVPCFPSFLESLSWRKLDFEFFKLLRVDSERSGRHPVHQESNHKCIIGDGLSDELLRLCFQILRQSKTMPTVITASTIAIFNEAASQHNRFPSGFQFRS